MMLYIYKKALSLKLSSIIVFHIITNYCISKFFLNYYILHVPNYYIKTFNSSHKLTNKREYQIQYYILHYTLN